MFGLFNRKSAEPPMTLEAQLDALAKLGFRLEEGVSVDDLLNSFDRQSYEARPFDLILFMLGTEVEKEPWGRPICTKVWNFDTECIYETGDYVYIVQRLCQIAQKPECLKDIVDFVDLESGQAWLDYTVDGKQRHWAIEVNNDWADTLSLSYVMADIEGDGWRFYFKDNGQAMVLYFLDLATAAELNRLSNGALNPVLPD